MKKFLAFILAALMLVSLVACGTNNNGNKKPNNTTSQNETKKPENTTSQNETKKPDSMKTATPDEIEKAIAKALGDGYLATVDVPEDEMFTSALIYLDLTKVKSYVAKQAMVPSVDLDAVVIAECEDGYADEAIEKLNESFAQSISYIRQYPFGVAKVEGARIYKVGNTVMLIIAGASYDGEDKEAEAKLAADEYKKIDDALSSLFGGLPENLAVVPKN